MAMKQLLMTTSFMLLVLLVVCIPPSEAFGAIPLKGCRSGSPLVARVVHDVACQSSVGGDDSHDNKSAPVPQSQESTLDVIQKCMDISSSAEPDGLIIRPTRPGLSGFAVDGELGFVAILTSSDPSNRQSTHVVVSPLDKQKVCSAEALCMVQMSGGMDLGTAILPPDCLAQLVADELEGELSVEEIRPRLKLLQVQAVSNPDRQQENQSDAHGGSSKEEDQPASTAERDAKLLLDVPKFMTSIQNLPGLAGICTEEQVLQALQLYAKADGSIDRAGFTAVLDSLRRQSSTVQDQSKVQFELAVSLSENSDNSMEQQLRVVVPTAVQALGLAMRYNKELQVNLEEYDMDVLEVLSRFPKFRPIEELEEDARLMDGFIPSMYAKVRAPKADDRE